MAYSQNIPKILHQIWIGPKPPPQQWLDSWKNKHPDWEYRLWTEKNIPQLENQKLFDQINSYSGKADILRYELLYQYGGIYLDADSYCLQPLDESMLRHHFFACYENEQALPGLVSQGTIGCEPNHPIMKVLIDSIKGISDINREAAWKVVGPILFTKVILEYKANKRKAALLPSYYFYPLHHSGACYAGKGKIFAMQHWGSTKEIVKGEESRITEDFFVNRHKERSGAPPQDSQEFKEALSKMMKVFKIKKLLEAPCRDYSFVKSLNLKLDWYVGINIIPEIILENERKYSVPRIYFDCCDLLRNRLPEADLILCRNCFNYCSYRDIQSALHNFKRSRSNYLLATNFTKVQENRDITTGENRPINLLKPPFNFPHPIAIINEEEGKTLALWKIKGHPEYRPPRRSEAEKK